MALLAVAIQLVLSFAHFHPLPSPEAPGHKLVQTGRSAAGDDHPAAPLAHDDCAICANIAAFASLDIPAPAQLDWPAIGGSVCLCRHPVEIASSAPYPFFRTRAPPIA